MYIYNKLHFVHIVTKYVHIVTKTDVHIPEIAFCHCTTYKTSLDRLPYLKQRQ